MFVGQFLNFIIQQENNSPKLYDIDNDGTTLYRLNLADLNSGWTNLGPVLPVPYVTDYTHPISFGPDKLMLVGLLDDGVEDPVRAYFDPETETFVQEGPVANWVKRNAAGLKNHVTVSWAYLSHC